ncbi:MAG TPA: peptidase M1, partial [Flavobacterium sp.]|nr:peptidase M1 [Flavobacterium sp.]
MKNLYLLLISLLMSGAYAQNHVDDITNIAHAEMKGAGALTNIAVNPNTQNYDVTYHKLEWTVNPNVQQRFISGVVTTTYTALLNMSTVTFDMADELSVSAVTVNNISRPYTHTNDELVITLASVQAAGSAATVKITYSGVPPSGEQAFVRSTHSGSPIIWTLSEPFGAKDWWPCKQDLNDKIDNIDVFITAPAA